MITRPDHQDPNAQDNMKPWKMYCFHKFTMRFCYRKDVTEMQSLEIDDMLRIRLREAGLDEEIFTSVDWIRAFNINEPIYAKHCHEFYSTYEFDETQGTHDNEAGSSRSKRPRQHETVEEVLLPQVRHEILLWEGCNRDAKSRMGCDGEIDDMFRIRLREAGSDEEIFTSVDWIRAFNINEPIYAELCH
nr:hypothetical protein [Tanacetum cinerariifolium]